MSATVNSSFKSRVMDKTIDLVELAERGEIELEYVSGSDRMLIKGKRHQIAAKRKSGKSLVALLMALDIAEAGGRVAILDRENGSAEYARRLKTIADARGYSSAQLVEISDRLIYLEFPVLRRVDGSKLASWLKRKRVDLTIFDSQRMFLTDLSLTEDNSDDYAKFMNWVIEPLSRKGIATLILDNTGHGNTDRSRGSSSKGDLNEVIIGFATARQFSASTRGEVVLTIDPGSSRFGNTGSWSLELGGGHYGSLTERVPIEIVDRAEQKTARVRAALLSFIGSNPHCAKSAAVKNAKNNGLGEDKIKAVLDGLVRDGMVDVDERKRLILRGQS